MFQKIIYVLLKIFNIDIYENYDEPILINEHKLQGNKRYEKIINTID